ncbi:exopolysaccharide production repressor protein [Rhizobium mongolense]|uniref:exopolysaccharide production repressor protein n=1 Tax=Rhizobium mongolense TaxID=57676 RepID=UPI003558F860
MRFGVFHRILWLLMCTNALVVYCVSQSVRRTIVTTLAVSFLLQLAYFGSLLFLVWRAGCDRRTVQRGVVAWITRRLILSGGFQSPDPDFDDAAHVQCRSGGTRLPSRNIK